MSGLDAIGQQFLADEHADQRAAAARLDAFTAETGQPPAAPAVPSKSEEQQAAEEQAKQLEQMAQASLPLLTKLVWTIADRGIQSFAGSHAAATPDEIRQLAELSVPVLNKYVTGSLGKFINTPEGLLAVGAAMIYAPKIISGPPAPAAVPEAPAAPEVSA